MQNLALHSRNTCCHCVESQSITIKSADSSWSCLLNAGHIRNPVFSLVLSSSWLETPNGTSGGSDQQNMPLHGSRKSFAAAFSCSGAINSVPWILFLSSTIFAATRQAYHRMIVSLVAIRRIAFPSNGFDPNNPQFWCSSITIELRGTQSFDLARYPLYINKILN